MLAYIVMECAASSAVWTVARKDPDSEGNANTAYFLNKEKAEQFCAAVMSKRRAWLAGKPDQQPMDWHIAEVNLPDREEQRIACKEAYDNRFNR
jgi:hypothetical protein